MRDKLTIEAGLFTTYPGFRDMLTPILKILAAKGGAYSPDLVEFRKTGRLQRERLTQESASRLAEVWEELPFNSMLHFQKLHPAEVHMHIGNTLGNFNVVGMNIEQGYVSETGKPQEIIDLFKELYDIVHPIYGNVLSQDTVRWFDSPLGKVNPGTNLRRALPDIYWANFLGPEYVEMFGPEKVDSAPCHSVERLPDGGVLLVLSPSPLDFLKDRDSFEKLRLELKRHLGEDAFDKGLPETQGKVPAFRYIEKWDVEFAKWKAEYNKHFETTRGSDFLSTVPRREWERWIENNPKIANDFAREMGRNGLALDFSRESLDKLDSYIEVSAWGKTALSRELVEKLGAYVTQVIIRDKAAEWAFTHSEEIPTLTIGNVHLTPLARVLKVLTEGEKIAPWYDAIDKIKAGIDAGKPGEG